MRNPGIWLPALVLAGLNHAGAVDIAKTETEDLRLLYFDPTETYLVPHVGRSFENSLEFQREIFHWDPWDDRTTVLLKDFADYGNAGARSDPNNAVLIDIAPLSHTFETFPATERMFMLANHELVHVATMDAWATQESRWRRFFGGKVRPISEQPGTILWSYLTTPRVAVPRWYLEGSAVFMETWMSGGIGRAQGGFDEMVFRSMVRDEAHFYDALGLVSAGTQTDFQVGVNAYLYGTRFMSYLGYQYSPEHVIEWLSRNEGSERYYAKQFKHVFGLPLADAWQDWIIWEHEFQGANLDAVREFPTTQYEQLVTEPLGSVSRAFIDSETRTLYGAFRYPGVVAHVGALSLDDGSVERLTDIKGPMLYRVTSLAWDPDSKTLFYTTDNHWYRDIVALDVTTGKSRRLFKNARIGELVFNPTDRSLWGVRHLNGISTLVQIPYPYEEWTQIHSWPYGQNLSDLDISPNGKLLSASIDQISGDQTLQVFYIEPLKQGEVTPMARFDFGVAIPEGFVFSPDGRYLYGSSYYTGVSNIFRYEIQTGEIEAVSNAETGFFRPIPLEDGRVVVFAFTGQGFIPALIAAEPIEDVSAITFLGRQIAEKHPIVREWQVGSPADIDLDSRIVNEGVYKPIRELGFESWFPIIQGYKDSIAGGARVNFSDPLGLSSLFMTLSYSPDNALPSDEKLHGEIAFQHVALEAIPGVWTAKYRYNFADFYDIFGPTLHSLKGSSISVDYEKALIFDLPKRLDLKVGAAHYTNLDRLPNFQNVPTAVKDLTRAGVELDYSHVRKSLGAVDDEKGYRWDFITGAEYRQGDTVPKFFGTFDFGFALPLKHSSIWIRNAAGFADGNRSDELANFFFGSFGNNYVDDAEVKQYREWSRFPGFEIDTFGGRSFGRAMLEWNLPPIRFERAGTPGFYTTWGRPALFTSAIVTNPNSSVEQTRTNIGGQIDFRFTVVHRLDMTLSFGYAVGYLKGDRADDEFMISLKVM